MRACVRVCVFSGCYTMVLKACRIMLVWWMSRLALTNTFITLETTVTETQGHMCQSYSKGTMATILGLIQETLWSGWNGECQASENTSQHESTGNGSRELFSNGGFDRSGPVIKRQPFTWWWQCVCVCVCASVYVCWHVRVQLLNVSVAVRACEKEKGQTSERGDRIGRKTDRKKKSKNRE